MKLLIFNKGKGWYLFGTNYKDKTDVAYMNIFFPKDTAPQGDKQWIDIKNCAFTSYNHKIGMTVFDYELTDSPKASAEKLKDKIDEFVQDNEIDLSNVSPDELPFY